VFKLIASPRRVERAEMEKTFNMGVGMVAVLPADDVDRALAVLTARHVPTWVLGHGAPVRRPGRRRPGLAGPALRRPPPASDPWGPLSGSRPGGGTTVR
jgi:phosphoribosylformylglycinamidine cyclo-ligase